MNDGVTEVKRLISNSELSSFRRCRRRWMLSYYRALQTRVPDLTGARQVGTVVHEALAAYYTPGSTVDPLVRLAECYESLAARAIAAGTEWPDIADRVDTILARLRDERELSTIMVEGYLEWVQETGADAGLEVVGAEESIEYPLEVSGQRVYLTGKLDIRVRHERDGTRSFMDTKTGGSISGITKMLPFSTQLTLYMLLERLTEPDNKPVTSGVYNCIRRVKRTAAANPPFYSREQSYRSEEELRNFWYRLHGEIGEILRAEQRLNNGENPTAVCYPNATDSCSWDCDFIDACLLMDGGAHAEQFISEQFVTINPYQRYE